METRIKTLEDNFSSLLQKFLPPVVLRLKDAEGLIAAQQDQISAMNNLIMLLNQRLDVVEKLQPQQESTSKTKKPMNYGDFVEIKKLEAQKVPTAEIARQLSIPYTTVRKYLLDWQEDTEFVAQKRIEWEQQKQAPAAITPTYWIERGKLAIESGLCPVDSEAYVVCRFDGNGYSVAKKASTVDWGKTEHPSLTVIAYRYATAAEIASVEGTNTSK